MNTALAADWSSAATPVAGAARAIGGHANGCIAGAAALPAEGPGFQTLRPSRNRAFGHPATIAFIAAYGASVADLGTVLVGDVSQPRGGPMSFGHDSHQTGLDVDVWFRLPSAPLSAAELETPQAQSVLDPDGTLDAARWPPAYAELLRRAAAFPEVERIFVNPAIKRAMCRTAGEAEWLRKLRPWWGHDAHFHIRLSCPAEDADCTPQTPLAEGDGCGADLDWWFSEEAKAPRTKPAAKPVLPAGCAALLPPNPPGAAPAPTADGR